MTPRVVFDQRRYQSAGINDHAEPGEPWHAVSISPSLLPAPASDTQQAKTSAGHGPSPIFPREMSVMRTTFALHPIHSLLTCGLLLTVLLLLGKQHSPYPTNDYPSPVFSTRSGGSSDLTLSERLARSEKLFLKSKSRRKELQRKFGADPPPYPENKRPHPPYTCMPSLWL